jgi:hypothetical protein
VLGGAPVILSVIGFFLKREIHELERELKKLGDVGEKNHEAIDSLILETKLMNQHVLEMKAKMSMLDLFREEWAVAKRDISEMSVQHKNARELYQDVSVLKRDQSTIWKRIDEQKEYIDHLRCDKHL